MPKRKLDFKTMVLFKYFEEGLFVVFRLVFLNQ
jgi:hypothetical protein